MEKCQSRPAWACAQIVLLRPIEIRLLPHLRPAFAGRDGQRPDVHAVRLGPLQQRHMAQPGGGPQQRPQQVAQHPVVGLDLPVVAPPLDQPGQFEQRRIDQMRHVTQRLGRFLARGRVGQIQSQMPARETGRRAGVTRRPPECQAPRKNVSAPHSPPARSRPPPAPFSGSSAPSSSGERITACRQEDQRRQTQPSYSAASGRRQAPRCGTGRPRFSRSVAPV